MKRYELRTLGMLGQMYEASGEEVNFPSGTKFYSASEVEELLTDIASGEMGLNVIVRLAKKELGTQ